MSFELMEHAGPLGRPPARQNKKTEVDIDETDRLYEFINGHLSNIPGINSVKTEFLLQRYKVQRSLMV